MKKCFVILDCLCFGLIPFSFAQSVGIGNVSFTPDVKAMLEIRSTNSGLLIPRMTSAQRLAIAPTAGNQYGLLVYQTDATAGYWYWNGASWVRLFSGSGEAWNTLGNAGTLAGTNFLGTTDGQALDFRTGNVIRFQVANGFQVFGATRGTAPLPFYSFSLDPNTGMYSSGADCLNFSTAGFARVTIDNYGSTGHGTIAPYTSSIGGVNVLRLNVVASTTPAAAAMTEFVNSSNNGLAIEGFNTSNSNGYSSIEACANGPGVAFKGIHKPNFAIGFLGYGVGVEGSSNSYDGVGVSGISPADVSLGDLGAAGYFDWDVICGDVWIASDERLKENINEYSGALKDVMDIKVFNYSYNRNLLSNTDGRTRCGFLAQDLEKTFPGMVKEKRLYKSGQANSLSVSREALGVYKVVNYIEAVPILTRAIQEQQELILKLEKRITELENQIKK